VTKAADVAAVAATNCRRDSLRDICSLPAIYLFACVIQASIKDCTSPARIEIASSDRIHRGIQCSKLYRRRTRSFIGASDTIRQLGCPNAASRAHLIVLSTETRKSVLSPAPGVPITRRSSVRRVRGFLRGTPVVVALAAMRPIHTIVSPIGIQGCDLI
jgi:hypothetical protein